MAETWATGSGGVVLAVGGDVVYGQYTIRVEMADLHGGFQDLESTPQMSIQTYAASPVEAMRELWLRHPEFADTRYTWLAWIDGVVTEGEALTCAAESFRQELTERLEEKWNES